jgi:hypothetical protein
MTVKSSKNRISTNIGRSEMLSRVIYFIKEFVFILPFTALLISNGAFAHDGIKSQVLEGTSGDNAITIGHSCEQANGTIKPIIAQSVVFPGADPVLTATDSAGSSVTAPTSLIDVIEQGEIAGLVDSIQSKDIFTVQKEKTNAIGSVTGFYGKSGSLSVESQGRVPFAFTSPNFVTTSCVKKLNIVVAIADICVVTNPKIQAGKVNLWIPDNGSQYAIQGAAAGVDGIGFEPPTLQVNRDLAANPFVRASRCGAGIDVTVTPSPADIDANLGIPGYWSK